MQRLNMNMKNVGKIIKKGLQTVLTSNYFVLIIIVFIFLVFVPILPVLTNINNLTDMLSNIWPLLAIAIGQTVVFIIAGIDLSQTSIMAFTSVVGALLITKEADTLLLGSSPAWGWLVTENRGCTWLRFRCSASCNAGNDSFGSDNRAAKRCDNCQVEDAGLYGYFSNTTFF